MALLDSVHEQATQILLNHAEIPMIMCNIYNSIPATHFVSSIIMKMKVELLMIKHSQAHKNSTLQYKIQQSVFRAKNWGVPPYISKYAQVQLIPSVVCYL